MSHAEEGGIERLSPEVMSLVRKGVDALDLGNPVSYVALLLYARASSKMEESSPGVVPLVGACLWVAAKMRGRDVRLVPVANALGCSAEDLWDASDDVMEVLGLKVVRVLGEPSEVVISVLISQVNALYIRPEVQDYAAALLQKGVDEGLVNLGVPLSFPSWCAAAIHLSCGMMGEPIPQILTSGVVRVSPTAVREKAKDLASVNGIAPTALEMLMETKSDGRIWWRTAYTGPDLVIDCIDELAPELVFPPPSMELVRQFVNHATELGEVFPGRTERAPRVWAGAVMRLVGCRVGPYHPAKKYRQLIECSEDTMLRRLYSLAYRLEIVDRKKPKGVRADVFLASDDMRAAILENMKARR